MLRSTPSVSSFKVPLGGPTPPQCIHYNLRHHHVLVNLFLIFFCGIFIVIRDPLTQ